MRIHPLATPLRMPAALATPVQVRAALATPVPVPACLATPAQIPAVVATPVQEPDAPAAPIRMPDSLVTPVRVPAPIPPSAVRSLPLRFACLPSSLLQCGYLPPSRHERSDPRHSSWRARRSGAMRIQPLATPVGVSAAIAAPVQVL